MTAALLQKAIYDALIAASPVSALVGARIYDRVPPSVVFPFIRIGEDQLVDDSTSCFTGFEIFSTVHVFSRAVGRVEAKNILEAARDALAVSLALAGHTVKAADFVSSRVLDDPDGLTAHGILELRYLIEVG
jgi:hypothetical protein